MLSPESIDQLTHNIAFINAVLVLGAFLIIAKFLIFVRKQWVEGLTLHLTPCVDCHNPLSPTAAFCPSCGRIIQENPLFPPSETTVAASDNGSTVATEFLVRE